MLNNTAQKKLIKTWTITLAKPDSMPYFCKRGKNWQCFCKMTVIVVTRFWKILSDFDLYS